MARFYADEDFPGPTLKELRKLGQDVLTVRQEGRSDQSIPDDEVLADAGADQRILLTKNRHHFRKIHRLQPVHEGIVAITEDHDYKGLADRIHQRIVQMAGTATGQFIPIDRPNQAERKIKKGM